ncbi:MAG: dihydrodipicolinate synthase family protein [Rubellimicrobium sp.]|nr:dihydrodipicolinate synthase family protein [Rubellimicrobium sp.]
MTDTATATGPWRTGIHAVLYALFDDSEAVDHAAMVRQVDHVVAGGVAGVTVLGLATEVGKLSFQERCRVIDTVSAALAGRLAFSVTIAGNSVAEQRALLQVAGAAGADWVILQPPVVGSYGPGVYIDFLSRVAEATDLPVAIQNAPQYLGRSLSPEDIALLRGRCARLVGVKAEDGALGLAALASAAPDLALIGGRGGLEFTDALRLGVTSFVLAPDVAPRAARLLGLWTAGQMAEAEALYGQSLPAIVFAMQSLEHLITYGKRIYGHHAGEVIHDRAPCLPPTPEGMALAAHWAGVLAEPA